MKLSVIGCGYLGAVHAASMAQLGHEVIGVDTDPDKIALLSAGRAPFFEPGLDDLLASLQDSGRLRFTTDISEIVGATAHFVAVGTPQRRGENAADLTFVDGAIEALLPYLSPGDVVVGKSTVPVGTAERLALRIQEVAPGAHLAWNPEFLREGFAVADTLTPDRIVYGVAAGESGERATEVLGEVYESMLAADTPLIVTDYATAELVKVAANAFLATKISFINAMAEVCEIVDADVVTLSRALGYDDRIGKRFLNAGLGFGGGCLPKDIRAFSARAGELGASDALRFLHEVDKINLRRREKAVAVARALVGGDFLGKSIAVLGAAFKPNSDDVRDSPALNVAAAMHLKGADVRVHDPKAIEKVAREKFNYCKDGELVYKFKEENKN